MVYTFAENKLKMYLKIIQFFFVIYIGAVNSFTKVQNDSTLGIFQKNDNGII